jgi:hypothetical protein
LVKKQFPVAITIKDLNNNPVPNALVYIDGYQLKSDKNGRVLSSKINEPGAKINVSAGQNGYRDFNSIISLGQPLPDGKLSSDVIKLSPISKFPNRGFDNSAYYSRERRIRWVMIGVIILLSAIIVLLSYDLFFQEYPKNREKKITNTPSVTPIKVVPVDEDSIFIESQIVFNDSTYKAKITEIKNNNKIDSSGFKYKRSAVILELLEKVPVNPNYQQIKDSINPWYHKHIEKQSKINVAQEKQLLEIMGADIK